MTFRILPIRTLLYYLTTLLALATVSVMSSSMIDGAMIVRNSLLIFFGAFFGYFIILKLKLTTKTRIEHRLITCLILSLLFYIGYPWFFYLGLGLLVELLQRGIRFPTGPIFNPAAFVATVATFFHYSVAWWGASFSPRIPILRGGISSAVILTLPLGLYVAWKYRKLIIVGAFILMFFLMSWLLSHRIPLFVTFEGTLLFFVLVMVIEPKTSPIIKKEQLIFGMSLGVLVPLLMRLHVMAPYLIALLLCNVVFNTYRNRKTIFKPKLQPLVVSPQVQ